MLNIFKNKLGNGKAITILFIFTIIIYGTMAFILKDINMKEFINMQITLNKDTFVKIINSWDNNQILEYHNHFYLDFLYLISYSLLMFSVVSRFYIHAKVKTRGTIFLILPFIIAFFDLIENVFHIYFITVNYKMPAYLVMISGICSIQKWVFLFVELYVIAVLFFKLTILQKR